MFIFFKNESRMVFTIIIIHIIIIHISIIIIIISSSIIITNDYIAVADLDKD